MYRIGFDAKRLFHNTTGLGNYSRSLLRSLKEYYPENTYILYSPSITYNDESFFFTKEFETVTPSIFMSKSFWRSHLIVNSLVEKDIDIYHGLSHELPLGIEDTTIKTVVTIHDLIYKLFPSDFPLIDKKIYDLKWKNSCQNANAIIATSEATKNDIVKFFKVDPKKISVVYQTCSSIFDARFSEDEKHQVLEKVGLPSKYLLYVGAIMDRKNVLSLVKAYNLIKNQIDIPLVIVGKGRDCQKKLMAYIEAENLQDKVFVCSSIGNDVLPIVYQCAEMFLYPSCYEGFGIPILEAFRSGVPVVISNMSSLPEVGGDACYYIDPYNIESIARAIMELHENKNLRMQLVNDGFEQAKKFTLKEFANKTDMVYRSLM
ncbi:MAG: glycosyltransferase family 4 protein [Bacteroidales bacterium]|nr:glycosyltransferase family 4 protein [Bacteroidales bacterium]